MKNLKLSNDFELPATQYASQGNAILGIRDSGKSYTAMKVAEELLTAGIPIIAFDPTGIWKNLKIGVDGNTGFQVVVVGGNEPDMKVTADKIPDVVRAAMQAGVSIIIDLYSLELSNKSTWIRIVESSIKILMYENMQYGLRHIFLEEAAEFIPQRIQPQHAKVYAEIERLARIGRNFGLGYTIINQRAEEVNKAILEIAELSLLHKQVGKNSLLSIQKWFNVQQVDGTDKIIKSLRELKQGECWVVGKEANPVLIKVGKKKTFHPNPKAKDHGKQSTVKKVDVSAFITSLMGKLKVDEQKVEGKKVEVKSSGINAGKSFEAIIQENKLLRAQNERLQADIKRVRIGIKDATALIIKKITPVLSDYIEQTLQALPTAPMEGEKTLQLPAAMPKIGEWDMNSVPTVTIIQGASSGLMRMLKAAALYDNITRARMATLARLSPTSGSFGTYLSDLKKRGWISGEKDIFQITDAGRAAAGKVDPLPTDPKELVEMWCAIMGNGSGSARILRTLAENYPNAVDRSQLARDVGMSGSSGSFGTYISTLKRNGLIKSTGKDLFICASELFA